MIGSDSRGEGSANERGCHDARNGWTALSLKTGKSPETGYSGIGFMSCQVILQSEVTNEDIV